MRPHHVTTPQLLLLLRACMDGWVHALVLLLFTALGVLRTSVCALSNLAPHPQRARSRARGVVTVCTRLPALHAPMQPQGGMPRLLPPPTCPPPPPRLAPHARV